MPEKPVRQEVRSAVSPKDRSEAPRPATSTDRDAKAPDRERPNDQKRIERYRER